MKLIPISFVATYTYTISLPLVRHGTEKLIFEEALAKNNSPKYTHLSTVVHDGLDRMVMQSDLRDIYHGVHLIEFKNASVHRLSNNDQQVDGSGLTSVFYLQLSDNYDDMRLLDILHKYLRTSNYSLGGTDLYTSNALINDMTATGCKTANCKLRKRFSNFLFSNFQISMNVLTSTLNLMIVRKMLIASIYVERIRAVVRKVLLIYQAIPFIRAESVQLN